MECRRCGKELPVGQTRTCPHCGIYLNTIITSRGSPAKTKKPMSRSLIMSFLSVALVVGVVCVFVPFMRNVTKGNMLTNIEGTFAELNGRKAEFAEDDWEKRLAVYSGIVDRFRKAYPKDQENIEMAERYLNILCGLDPDDPSKPLDPDGAQREYNELLIGRAKAEILDILELSVTKPDSAGRSALTITVKNTSHLIVSEIQAEAAAFDANGRPSNGSKWNDNKWYIRSSALIRPGGEDTFYYPEPWSNDTIDHVKIVWIEVTYGPGESVFFPEEVCAALWG